MRKLLGVLMAVMMVMSVMAINVFALTSDEIGKLPDPASDATLMFSYQTIESGGEKMLRGSLHDEYAIDYAGESPCKVVTYRSDTGKFYCGVTELIKSYNEDLGDYVEDEALSLKEFDTFEAAFAAADVSDYGDPFYTVLEYDAIALFSDASSGSVWCKCSVAALPDYSKDISPELSTSDSGSQVSLSASVIEYTGTGVDKTGAKVRLMYNLPGYKSVISESLLKEEAVCAYVYGIDERVSCSGVSGSVDLLIESGSNKTYTLCLETDASHTYRCSISLTEITSAVPKEFDGSWDEPIVRVDTLPDEASSPLTVKLIANMPVQWSWNGEVFEGYSTEFSIDVGDNGTYYYTVSSEVGQVTFGSVDISCIVFGADIQGLDLVPVSGTLVQTGVTSTNYVLLAVTLCIIAGLSFCGAIILRKRGASK